MVFFFPFGFKVTWQKVALQTRAPEKPKEVETT